MKIDFQNCTEEELWKYVASHLKQKGIDTVLVGGAVVSIYTSGIYESGDLDFILTDMFVKKLPEYMKEIGFVRKGRHFVHPECSHLFIEFPKGPLEIGDDLNIVPEEITVDGVKIKILSPTDCVKDRLATYIYFKDRVGIDQAVLVAKNHPVNFGSIQAWCEKEKSPQVFEEFKNYLTSK
jgi:hypothetical protein